MYKLTTKFDGSDLWITLYQKQIYNFSFTVFEEEGEIFSKKEIFEFVDQLVRQTKRKHKPTSKINQTFLSYLKVYKNYALDNILTKTIQKHIFIAQL